MQALRMFGGVLVLLAMAAPILATDGDDWKPPKWCHGHECPHFKTLKTDHGVEQRTYPGTKWVATNISSNSWDDAVQEAKKRLDDYWQGNNQPGAKIDRTVPMFTLLYPTGQGQAVSGDFTFEYFLPAEYHDSPPAPKAPEVTVVEVPSYNVWIRVFGGFADGKEILNQGFSFMDQLEKELGVKVQRSQFGFAQYDDPIHLVNRHNEIWVWEETSPSVSRTNVVAERLRQELAHIQAQLNALMGGDRLPA